MNKKLLVMACGLTALMAQAAKQPNIVLILADDTGYNDLGFQNNDPTCCKAGGYSGLGLFRCVERNRWLSARKTCFLKLIA